MGNPKISRLISKEENQNLVTALSRDLHSLMPMLENDWFETEPIRIGAEQEMVFVDPYYKPLPIAPDILQKLKHHPWLTAELSKFNLEIKLTPQIVEKDALRKMEAELDRKSVV